MLLQQNWVSPHWTWQSLGKSFLLFVFLLSQAAELEARKDHRFIWKTGRVKICWLICYAFAACGGGLLFLSSVFWFWSAWRVICIMKATLSNVVRLHPCSSLLAALLWGCSWATGAGFGSTTVDVSAPHCLAKELAPDKPNGTLAARDICEHVAPAPPTEQACLLPCPRDCVLSEFSRWSACGCPRRTQHRTRALLAPPLYGGAQCPNLTETRSCVPSACVPGEQEFAYSLRVGPWGTCRPLLHEDAGPMLDSGMEAGERGTAHVDIGYQSRELRCVRSDGSDALLSLCVPDGIAAALRPCVLPRDCETSPWSARRRAQEESCSPAPGSAAGGRAARSLVPPPCPLRVHARVATGSLSVPEKPLLLFSWRTSEWRRCRVSVAVSRPERAARCGGGVQTRDVFCAQLPTAGSGRHRPQGVTRPVDGKLCPGPMPAASQLCSVPCPSECRVSSWSPWGPCAPESCPERQGRRGFRMRHRRVLADPVGAPAACPHLTESLPCEDPVCYEWVVSEGVCVTDHGKCGLGHRVLKAVCRNHRGEEVPQSLCSERLRPEIAACEVPCAADCVVSEWAQWSPCSQSCSGKNAEGSQSRSRSIVALPAEGGKACPPARALREQRVCNEHPCAPVFWETSPWSACSEGAPASGLNGTVAWSAEAACGVGLQTRSVSCARSGSGHVAPKRCPESIRPEAVRPCPLLCKKDCVVTAFSEWTHCPTTCQPGNATAIKQSRYRIIIQEAANGGQACPDTLYEERECEDIPVCPVYRWKTHRWSHCVLVPDSVRQGLLGHSEACGQGLQSRAVTCLSENNDSADVSECLRWAGPMPSLVQECLVPCKDDCTFTPWSKFTACSSDCESTRSRRRSLTGRSRKRDKCQDPEVYPQVETEPCPCETFTSQPHGNWSDCIVEGGEAELPLGTGARGEPRECGRGVRLRAVACYDKTGRLVEPSRCSSSGYIEEPCTVPCPFDCRLSDWSSWAPCSSSCGVGMRIRSRWLKEKPYNGGRPCPKLDLRNQVHEAVPCYSECNQYAWAVEAWSPCTIDSEQNSLHCGEGMQTRKVRCVNTAEEHEGETVPHAMCNQSEIPEETQKCSLYCPGECAVSAWGQWSKCPQVCDPSVMQLRTRQVLRAPAAAKPCPEGSQMRPCILNQNCFQYRYSLTAWSTCQLAANATCGPGVRRRLAGCVRSDGRSVSPRHCQQLRLEEPAETSAECVVGCAVDCRLAPWSAWSECSHTCGTGGQAVRARAVLLPAQGGGRPCPAQLAQSRHCPMSPCYRWALGEWAPCRLQGGQCGDGFQVRNLTCVVHDASDPVTSSPVENALCGELPPKEMLQLPCSVPCPGDCHLTEWSEWSSCELTCIGGRSFETTGRQSRSRTFIGQTLENQESCPGQVMETRPCSGGKCYSYLWKTSHWQENERTVWCERSDGINVTGGCSLQTKPAEIQHCSPACRKPFSYCTQKGVCGCERGYTEIMRSDGLLDYCKKVPGLEDKKADVKTIAGKNKPVNSKMHDIFKGWSIQPFNPDGRLKMWVYGVSAGGFLVITLMVLTSFLM
ncbi:THS7B protein, partial [Eudromia elegans]|nr:THS7B protein [Eudromia elegans]